MKKEKFEITGMTCSACSSRVERAVNKLEGVSQVSVNLLKNSMLLEYDESKINTDSIIAAVDDAGYGAKSLSNKTPNKTVSKVDEHRKAFKRLIWSAIFCIPLFYISMGYMYSWPLPSLILGQENIMVFALAQLLLLIPILIINGHYFKHGFKNLIKLSPNMDTLISLGSGAAAIYSTFALFKMASYMGNGNMHAAHNMVHELYFEGAGTILTLISLGKFFEARAKGKTSAAIDKLMKLVPKTATIEQDGQEKLVSIDNLGVGDIIIVKAGESIACDGEIIYGNASIDESAISGESLPVDKSVDDTVMSGTICKSGFFKMRATHVASNSTLAQIIKLVDEATGSKAPIAKLADKVSSIFVPVVMTIALVTFIIWLISGRNFEFAMTMGISVLVISCPCALGLATPTAIMVGTGVAAKNGILFKSAEALEHSAKCNTIVLDKTGTITNGAPVVSQIESNIAQAELLKIAASLEKSSEHPLAQAIVAKYNNLDYYNINDFAQHEGAGISGTINGEKYFAGNKRLMNKNGVQLGESSDNHKGSTAIYIAKDSELLGTLYLADSIKDSSKETIAKLNELGLDTIMLTGDNFTTAELVADEVGVKNFKAELLPQDKEEYIRELQSSGKKVIMVGDGINDAPSLTRADIGIAIGAGTDIAIESADIVLMKSDLNDIPKAIELSRTTLRNIKQNLFWAFIYNIIGIPIAAGILYNSFNIKLNPMFAAFAMSMSSLFVVSNALRLRFFGANKIIQGEKDTMKIVLNVEGMSCPHCVKHVKDALEKINGVASAVPSLENKNVEIELSNPVPTEELIKAINDEGYHASK